jgi:hypothetical protein
MALFKKLFSSKLVANSDVIPAELNDEQDVNNENQNPVGKTKDDESKTNLITINWGTGLPIDVIFHYIHKNFEEEGFQDALVNSDITYRDTKEKIIRTDLEMLFKRITLRYKSDIREMVFKIDNARKAYALAAAAQLDSLKETYEEHLAEIEEMQELLNADDPKMTTMIESYRRGFLKGITAATLNYIEKK